MKDISTRLAERCVSIYTKQEDGTRRMYGHDNKFMRDQAWAHEIQFFEYFNAENGRGCGASHAINNMFANFMERVAKGRRADNKKEKKKAKKEGDEKQEADAPKEEKQEADAPKEEAAPQEEEKKKEE